MVILSFLICLFLSVPAAAQSPDAGFTLSLPAYMQMEEASKRLSPFQRAQLEKVAQPNETLALYFPAATRALGPQGIPEDVVIFAVPMGNPAVAFGDFPLLKEELRPRLREAGALIFEDNIRWMGATKAHALGSERYFLSSAIVALRGHVLMIQYLRLAQGHSDLSLLHSVMRDLVDHVVQTNSEPEPVKVQNSQDVPETKKSTPLFITR